MSKLLLIALALAFVLIIGIGFYFYKTPPTLTYVPYNPNPATVDQVTQNNQFSTDLLQQLNSSSSNKNIFISAYSISSALGMTYAGAAGTTAKEMEDVLHFGAGQAAVHRSFKEINQSLNFFSGKKKLDITISNQLWGQQGASFQPTFLQTIKDNYNSGLKELDFNQPTAAAESINTWVKQNTHNKISTIVNSGDLTNTQLVLTNAIYFYGAWANEFQKEKSTKGDFELINGEASTVDYMHRRKIISSDLTHPFLYAESADGELLELPYHDGKASMLIMLPTRGKDIQPLVKKMNDTTLSNWVNSLSIPKVPLHITLPKWKVAAAYLLKEPLIEMGMQTAFSTGADFSGMAPGLYISNIIHKTFIDVSEEGTEAAAVTGVVMAERSIKKPISINFRATRPFLYFIKDNTTGSILFAGQLMNPSSEEN